MMPTLHKMIENGGFWGKIGEALVLADPVNFETLISAFPAIEGQASETKWTAQSSTLKTEKTARLKLVWRS
jgi:hypothetical protein